MSDFRIELGQKLRALRTQNHLSQAALAKILGVSAQQIHKFETGKNALSINHLAILKGHFSLSLDEFVITKIPDISISYLDIRVDWRHIQSHKNARAIANYANEIKRLLQA